MREIKFRAWDTITKTMIYYGSNIVGADYIYLSFDGSINLMDSEDGGKDGLHEHDISYPEGRFELMQFTGLLDKHGKEIFEGDIVHHQKYGGNHAVEWTWKATGFFLKKQGTVTDSMALSNLCCPNIEIIGNIYENPELLTTQPN